MKFSDKDLSPSQRIKCIFPVLETFISSSLIKIVCKCNQIRGNESLAVLQEEWAEK